MEEKRNNLSELEKMAKEENQEIEATQKRSGSKLLGFGVLLLGIGIGGITTVMAKNRKDKKTESTADPAEDGEYDYDEDIFEDDVDVATAERAQEVEVVSSEEEKGSKKKK